MPWRKHRKKIQRLAQAVAKCKISFRWMSYSELWREWINEANLLPHVENLKKRYSFAL